MPEIHDQEPLFDSTTLPPALQAELAATRDLFNEHFSPAARATRAPASQNGGLPLLWEDPPPPTPATNTTTQAPRTTKT